MILRMSSGSRFLFHILSLSISLSLSHSPSLSLSLSPSLSLSIYIYIYIYNDKEENRKYGVGRDICSFIYVIIYTSVKLNTSRKV